MATTSDIGSTLLTSLTGSTFDVTNMSKVLAEAEVAGPRSLIESKQEKANTELDAFKYVQLNLNAFSTYITDLTNQSFFLNKNASSSDESVVSVKADANAPAGNYQIESRQLAQSNTQVANTVYASSSDTVGAGTLDITVGGQSFGSIDISAAEGNNTLEGLQKYINNGDYGVNAAIINNGSGYQLMFTSKESGSAGEISFGGTSSLVSSGFTTTAEAQDAVMVVNGLTVTSNTNTFDEVIEGVSFTLNATQIGAPKTISVGNDVDSVVDTVTSFVDVYNQLGTILDELGKYDKSGLSAAELESEEYQYYGDLAGNSILKSVKAQIKESLSGAIDELTSNYNSLGVVGMSFDREGVLQLDKDKLRTIAQNDMQALSNLFAKGGSATDNLINVIGGNDRTQTGSYEVNITQVAERAELLGGAVTYAANEYRVAGARITDVASALTIDSGASFDLTLNGETQTINLTAGSYADKDAVAAQIATQITNAGFTGGQTATVAYDSSQGRFEITTDSGLASVSNAQNLSAQGFMAGNYAGEQLIDLSAGASFDLEVDDAPLANISVQGDKYTLSELAQRLNTNINANSEIQTAGASVSVSTEGGILSLYSDRFGAFSSLTISNATGLANAGVVDGTDAGQSVDGTITTNQGTLNLGAYATIDDGRRIKISDFAVVGGEAADVRGMEFEVLGGAIGSRGNITFAQGFASRLEETIANLFEEDFGLVSQRMDSLADKLTEYDEQNTKLDARYEKLEMKYKMDFALLQSVMASAQATRDQLTAQFMPSN